MIPTDISDQFEQPGKLHVQCTQPSNCLSPRLSAFLSQPHRPFGISNVCTVLEPNGLQRETFGEASSFGNLFTLTVGQ